MEHLYPYPKAGNSFLEILGDALTRKLLGFEAANAEPIPFITGVSSRLKFLLNDATQQLSILKIGYTALEAFLQANCTGPPLDFAPTEAIFPESYRQENLESLRAEIFDYLAVDGSRPYSLTPHIELFWLAKVILSHSILAQAGFNGRRGRFRVNLWHQKLLSEDSSTLRDVLYSDAEILDQQLSARLAFGGAAAEQHYVEFLVERGVLRTYYGEDKSAREDLARGATIRQFQFVLTGALGKRTKFQDRDISQLVVLAKSRDEEPEPPSSRKNSRTDGIDTPRSSHDGQNRLPGLAKKADPTKLPMSPLSSPPIGPENLPLNDDTLLESIHFKTAELSSEVSADAMIQVASIDSCLPPQLAALEPADQPVLHPMDSIILLATASSITNTSPDDGLSREETLPYATRALEGGSSNWQVYTQALLVRSRIEGYRARTAERGLLQLQALVDQVIAETTLTPPENTATESASSNGASTFLPKPTASEAASVAERLQYIYQISPPFRWELEAELAQRWTAMGGLKTALEIYTRLQMHAEVALCLAATDEEKEAEKLLRNVLFTDETKDLADAQESLRSPKPHDTPRLLCILGDITNVAAYYEFSWKASDSRYARAQRSLGRHYSKQRDMERAAQAYSLALRISRLDRASWFALGCTQLELETWSSAVESFTRCVQLEDQDAESWSNLAVALLRLPPPQAEPEGPAAAALPDEETDQPTKPSTQQLDPYKHTRDALLALRRAATLKRDDARIWDNYLTVAASLPPSVGTPWQEIIQAMGRVIELRSKKEGESCIDLPILKVLTEYVTKTWTYPRSSDESEEQDQQIQSSQPEPSNPDGTTEFHQTQESTTNGRSASTADQPQQRLPFLPRSFLTLIDTQVTPLATTSPKLYAILSAVAQWRHRPHSSLMLAEKSWLSFLTAVSPVENFDDIPQDQWKAVVAKTIWMMNKYRDLGLMQRERTGGEVEKGWKFKAKSAARRVLGRAKTWEQRDDDGYERLKVVMAEL